MRHKLETILLGSALLCVFLFLAACQKQAPRQLPLTLNIGAEPSLLNPILSTDVPSSEVTGFVFSGLFRVSHNLSLIPDLATHYEVDEQGRHYTFYLRDDVTWHDGHPFDAHDVKFTFDKILDPKTNTVRRSNYIIEGEAIQFEVLNATTLKATLPRAFAPFLNHMTMGILPQHLLKDEDINTSHFNRQPVGTGPFRFETWQSAQFISLKRNETYYGQAPKLASIILKIIPDQNTALVALEKGEIDQAGIPGKDYDRYQDHPDFDIYRYEDLAYTFMGFNLKHRFFKDLKVRQALAMAVNKEVLVQHVLKGFGKTADLPMAPVSWAYPPADKITPYPYDPEQSKALLKAAGFDLNAEGLQEKAGHVFRFTLITNKGNKSREKSAQLLQRFFADIGVEMHIQLMEWSSFIKILNAPQDPKDFDAVMLGWSLGLDPDSFTLWHSSQYPKGFNFIAYQNPQVDDWLRQGRALQDRQARKTVYQALYQTLAAELPYLFLYYPETLSGIQSRVQGLAAPGPAGLMNPIEAIFLKD